MESANLAASAGNAHSAADAFHRCRFNCNDSLHQRRLDEFALLVEEAEANSANRTQAAQLRALLNREDPS